MGKFVDLSGQEFGRLTIIKRSGDKSGRTAWLCKCECGTEKEIRGSHITTGKIVSCGCFDADRKYKNGLSMGENGRIYKIHHGMIDRCYNEKNKRYKNYGGRGIVVCNEWLEETSGLINFHDWAIKNGYSEDLTIDRSNVNGNYEPSNCKWATDTEQRNNKTNSRFLTINEETKTVAEWSRESGVSVPTIRSRLNLGWTGEKLLSPPRGQRSMLTNIL